MALSTSTTARWRILSSSAATPNGRCRPSAFGIYTLRDGLARYAPRWSAAALSGGDFADVVAEIPALVKDVLSVVLAIGLPAIAGCAAADAREWIVSQRARSFQGSGELARVRS